MSLYIGALHDWYCQFYIWYINNTTWKLDEREKTETIANFPITDNVILGQCAITFRTYMRFMD